MGAEAGSVEVMRAFETWDFEIVAGAVEDDCGYANDYPERFPHLMAEAGHDWKWHLEVG